MTTSQNRPRHLQCLCLMMLNSPAAAPCQVLGHQAHRDSQSLEQLSLHNQGLCPSCCLGCHLALQQPPAFCHYASRRRQDWPSSHNSPAYQWNRGQPTGSAASNLSQVQHLNAGPSGPLPFEQDYSAIHEPMPTAFQPEGADFEADTIPFSTIKSESGRFSQAFSQPRPAGLSPAGRTLRSPAGTTIVQPIKANAYVRQNSGLTW